MVACFSTRMVSGDKRSHATLWLSPGQFRDGLVEQAGQGLGSPGKPARIQSD